jgi:hypothetical protein
MLLSNLLPLAFKVRGLLPEQDAIAEKCIANLSGARARALHSPPRLVHLEWRAKGRGEGRGRCTLGI